MNTAEENQDEGIHGRASGGDADNRRMETGEVPAAPSEHSVEVAPPLTEAPQPVPTDSHAQGTMPATEHVCKPSCHNPCLLDNDEKGKWRRPIGYVLTPFGEKIEREMCEYFGFPSPPTKVDGIVLEAIWHKLALLWPTAQPSAPSVSETSQKGKEDD
jgi:hypothetical protein